MGPHMDEGLAGNAGLGALREHLDIVLGLAAISVGLTGLFAAAILAVVL